jgi:hypothetical protein
MSDLTMNILGFPAVNRDLSVQLLDPVTQNVVRTVTPFLDGTVRVPNIDPGAYEINVLHPNLPTPVLRRPIRVLPVGPTNVTVLIDPSRFRNTPIEDVPDANLTPVADMTKSIAETVTALGTKVPGEAIKSQDWNTLANGVRDLSNTTGELTQLVSPIGHDHPELVAKINEMQTNFQTLLDTLTQALAELQRQIQTLRLQKQVNDLLDQASIDPNSAQGKEFTNLVDTLTTKVTDPPSAFSRSTRDTAVQLSTKLETLIDAHATDPNFANSAPVSQISTSLDLLKTNRASTYDAELSFNRKVDRTIGSSAIDILKR